MYKILLLLTTLLLLSGCSSLYDTAKPVYKAGKIIIKEIPLPQETRDKLKEVDHYLTTYDKARGVILLEYESGKLDVNTSEVLVE